MTAARAIARALRQCLWAAWLGWTTLAAAAAAVPTAFSPPALPAQAGTLAGFLPAGWNITQQVQADLNADGRVDAVLLAQPLAPEQPAAAVAGADAGWSPPRLLLVLLRSGAGWTLAAQNHRLVPRVDLSSHEDPLANGELSARRGGFRLNLGLAATMGSYQQATLRYSFRRQGGCVRLVTFERLELHRATLATQDLHIDYLRGTVLHRNGNAQTEASQQRRERLPAQPRRCLPDLDDAASFKPL